MLLNALPSVEARAQETIETLFAYIQAQGHREYGGEKVSQLEHSLQAGNLARQAGADEETILAALLHDIGHFIPMYADMPNLIAPNGSKVGRKSHDHFGETYLRELGFSDKICQLVGAHVMAKRYLTAVDKEYYDTLSEVSKNSLRLQGGIFTKEEVAFHSKDPLLEEKLMVRRWDDLAKIPGREVEPLADYEIMARKSLLNSWSHITLHGRTYNLPTSPTVVICVDGFDPAYLEQGIADGLLPNMASFIRKGFHATVKSAMPSFTNPNNVSIITGVPTSVHGIAGNFYLDRETGKEHMIVDDTLLRGSTILEKMCQRGVKIAAVTAKDKLRRILSHGLNGAICFSAEKANECTVEKNGISDVENWLGRAAPEQYSGDLSLYVLDAGIKLLQESRAELLYLTLSDFVQHKYAPGEKESNEFLKALDQRIGQLSGLGAVVAITGDHGMSDKSRADGTPNVIFLQDELEAAFGAGSARVITPISDPYVRHHGALGSFVRVYASSPSQVGDMIKKCKSLVGVELVLNAEEAAFRFEMPLDREGDFVVIAQQNAVIGSRKEEHDLSNLEGHRLRSHGGISEQKVPLIMSHPARAGLLSTEINLRNFDIFDVVLNRQI